MNKYYWPLVLALVLARSAFAEMGAADIMDKNFLSARVATSKSVATLTLKSSAGDVRIRSVSSVSILGPNGIDNTRLTRFTGPAEVAGMATLTAEDSAGEDNIWVYLPSSRQTRRIQSGDKSKPFLGTDFSYGDIMGMRVSDWTYGAVAQEPCGAARCFVIDATAKDASIADAAGVFRRKLWINSDNFVAVKIENYDQGGALTKRLTASDVKLIDAVKGRYQPMNIRAENVQTQHVTEIRFTTFDANVAVSDDQITPKALENGN